MPKIKKNVFKIRLDKTVETITVDLQYYEEKFFYEIPEYYNKCIDGMHEDKKAELFIGTTYKTKNGIFKAYVVRGLTEKDCEEKYVKTLTELMNTSIEKRNVIIVFYKNQNQVVNFKNPNRLSSIGLLYSVVYAVETNVNGNKSYNIETVSPPNSFRSEPSINYEKVDNSYQRNMVIDDTPENRKTVELLYKGLELLISKIEIVTGDAESFNHFISSGQKLISE